MDSAPLWTILRRIGHPARMTDVLHATARAFFDALNAGDLPDALLTDDMTAWTTSAGVDWPRAQYQGGVRLLHSLFAGDLAYTIDSLTAEGDRVVAQARGAGTLVNGDTFANRYVFVFTVQDGRIARVEEHFDPRVVERQLVPLIQARMAAARGDQDA
jgi:uncharacterized protein